MMTRKEFIAAAMATNTDECILWPYAIRNSGYGAFSLKNRGQTINYDAHRYVCQLSHGESPTMEAAHRCGRKLCINSKHLYWATHEANMADAKAHGTVIGGGRYRQRFFGAEIAYIKASNDSCSVLAEKFHTDVSNISRLRRKAA
jgi:hypothetical protein